MGTQLWGEVKHDETWKYPIMKTIMRWTSESILTPQLSTFRNRLAIHNLTLQMETSVNAIQLGFAEINEQLQATAKMTTQNRLALDLLLLHEHEVCVCLNLNNNSCCVHITNATL